MNSVIRSTRLVSGVQRRLYSTETPKVSATKGGVIGFLLGVTAAGSAGYYYLLSEYNNLERVPPGIFGSSRNQPINEFQVKDYARRIETVDRDVAKLKETMATKKQLTDLKGDFRKLYDTLNMEHLELKTHVWGLEKDLSNSSNKQE
ncbi:hypothetical protein K501DRAFT_273150 [Backusella circina FSU 941]|nr:hypothetical protein K501DRAFT_273150 [Backusella circina FSU 941]